MGVMREDSFGPLVIQPKFLRTKYGDVLIQDVESRGPGTGSVDPGLLVADCPGPIFDFNSDPFRNCKGDMSKQMISNPESSKGGRIKKAMKKPQPFHPYLPGSKHHKFYELSKGGQKIIRKNGGRGKAKARFCNSIDSDPIDSAEMEGGAEIRLQLGVVEQVRQAEGINLEVVLPFFEGRDGSNDTQGVRDLAVVGVGTGMGNSGLSGLLGNLDMVTSNVVNEGIMVDKERGDAQHIIDIQDDLGIHFKGDINDEVERCMRMEQRDRLLKNERVQGNSYQ
jgi:hypothetical protein